MNNFDKYQRTAEGIKDSVLEENKLLTRQLAEARQSFELLKFVHSDKSINLEKLTDIIVGCTGCLYSMMFYNGEIISNLSKEDSIYDDVLEFKTLLLDKEELFVSDKLLPDYTVVVYPISMSQLISDSHFVNNIILIYTNKFVTDEVLVFVKSFMIVNDVLINIVLMREKMLSLIETDPLTGLLNRNSWNDNLEKLSVSDNSFSVIFIDIDNFKNINDSYGHQKGDQVLKLTSKWLKNIFRDEDMIFRLGGDEFAITCNVDSIYIDRIVLKLNSLTDEYTLLIRSFLGIDATISIGALITNSKITIDREKIYSRVDSLLYQSKQKGRNTITITSDL